MPFKTLEGHLLLLFGIFEGFLPSLLLVSIILWLFPCSLMSFRSLEGLLLLLSGIFTLRPSPLKPFRADGRDLL